MLPTEPNTSWPNADISLSEGAACEAVRCLSYWPDMYDMLVGIAVEEGEFGPHFELGGES